jgi:Ankyrin repeats (3 copies)
MFSWFKKRTTEEHPFEDVANAGQRALLLATFNGDTEAVRALLRDGVCVDAKDGAGPTALMWAAKHDHADLVQTLLDAGADPALKDRSFKTAMGLCPKYEGARVMELLHPHFQRQRQKEIEGYRLREQDAEALMEALRNASEFIKRHGLTGMGTYADLGGPDLYVKRVCSTFRLAAERAAPWARDRIVKTNPEFDTPAWEDAEMFAFFPRILDMAIEVIGNVKEAMPLVVLKTEIEQRRQR